jgi:hypothetical protein
VELGVELGVPDGVEPALPDGVALELADADAVELADALELGSVWSHVESVGSATAEPLPKATVPEKISGAIPVALSCRFTASPSALVWALTGASTGAAGGLWSKLNIGSLPPLRIVADT